MTNAKHKPDCPKVVLNNPDAYFCTCGASKPTPPAATADAVREAQGLAEFYKSGLAVKREEVALMAESETALRAELQQSRDETCEALAAAHAANQSFAEQSAQLRTEEQATAAQAEQLDHIRNIVDAQDSGEDTPTLVERETKALGRLVDAQAGEIKRLRGGLNHIMQQGSLPGTVHGEWLLSNIARETLYPTPKPSTK